MHSEIECKWTTSANHKVQGQTNDVHPFPYKPIEEATWLYFCLVRQGWGWISAFSSCSAIKGCGWHKGLCNWSHCNDVYDAARVSVPLPDLALTLSENNKLTISIFIRLPIRFCLTHNLLWQIPLTVSLSGLRYMVDLRVSFTWKVRLIFFFFFSLKNADKS